ncbi:MAG TPA: hypothetical protein VMX17_11310 [Candidatus Glassbacteria bacterium]|nr:hypothetical protein [Candidatus Glassbacteria bacterium]
MKSIKENTNQWDDHGHRMGLWVYLANSDSNGNWGLSKALYLEDRREGEQIIIRGKKFDHEETKEIRKT